MASPPSIAQPVPARSPEKASVDLRHPIPDLQSLQGAYVGNIERLEEHAERMSESGSDLGEEIRRLNLELKRSDSRQSREGPTRQFSTRSRNVSTSSHANSIVDVNGAARWGGYSPGGYVTSPVGSLRSGSWSNPSASIQRQRSESKASRLGQVMHPDEVAEESDAFRKHAGSPQSLKSAPLAVRNADSPPPQDTRRVSSFTRKYDEIANELRDELRHSVILDQPSVQADDYHNQYNNHHDYPDRPPTAASTDTTRQARTLWQDFDGVHCPDTVPEEEPTPSYGSHSRHSSYNSMLRQPYSQAQGAPPPDDSMVFYPAPVPKMLNLPKRLSQLPAANIQARRRTQLLDSMQVEKRQSAPLIGEMLGEPSKPKQNRKSMAALPPQLRASAYFDQVAPTQEFAVQGESAEDTLDSILNASARAPVFAFTDHPFAGHVGNEVYGPEQRRRASKLPEVPPTLEETKRRSSFNLLDTKRNSSGDPLNKLRKRNSSADMNLLVVMASESRMSLGDELDEHDPNARGPEAQDDHTQARRSHDDEDGRNPDDVYDEEHMEDEQEPEEPEEQPYFGAPTTLLAELQMRKAKQKSRNLVYQTLVDEGKMPVHRTLLELNDTAEKEKQKRMKKKINLAWEAAAEDEDSEDDVPLGVLYQKNRPTRSEMDRPVAHLAVPTTTTPGPETDEEEGETLADRMRRLKEKKELDTALGEDVRKSTISMDFASEMLNTIGVTEDAEKNKHAPQPTPSPGAEEEETLGQRRARLQAEAAARGETAPTRPGLRTRMSMADVLSANPIDVHNQARKMSDQQLISHLPEGSLLQQNIKAEERRKAERLQANMRSSSFGAYDPLVRAAPAKNDDDTPLALKIQAYKNKMSGLPTTQAPGMMYNNMGNMSSMTLNDPRQSMMGMNGMGMMSQPNLNMMQQPQMMPMNMNMGMMGMQPGMNFQYPQVNGMNGMRQNSMMNMPMGMQVNGMMMPMGMNGMGMMMPPMDPRQRDNIDRWMQGIQH
ncbi:hypothetical protein EK21DRAFT_51753 [Setomelanomma holmii]|uniref:Uncharacterized protein n=1 Tax=Setomelanomma holmii TaxID=210430 RepID=A0A9P4HM29_9PLEO|nr:hypothetical protein EK21DRAFT_51753 [Setomelanomma holmii]